MQYSAAVTDSNCIITNKKHSCCRRDRAMLRAISLSDSRSFKMTLGVKSIIIIVMRRLITHAMSEYMTEFEARAVAMLGYV